MADIDEQGIVSKRQNTTLEAEGAEFLVLGNLLILGIPAYKSYRQNAGYDLVAVNPERNKSARLEVKSRWASDAHWNMGMKDTGATDFYIYVRLNRGNRYRAVSSLESSPPQFFVLPEQVALSVPRTGWGQARLRHLPDVTSYQDRWDLVADFLA